MDARCSIHGEDLDVLRRAKETLENPSFLIRLADGLGKPFDWAVQKLPANAGERISDIARAGLEKALDVALRTMDGSARAGTDGEVSGKALHKALAVTSGAVGGAFGLAGLAVEVPVTTVVIMRAIADIARQHGEDLSDPAARLQCLVVFALGGSSQGDDSAESAYFGARLGLARAVSEAAEYLAGHGLAEKGAPALVRLIAAVASRFEAAVAEKAAAAMVPLVGALGGAAVNAVFISHFQRIAEAHFTVRRLERKYGPEEVRKCYEALEGDGATMRGGDGAV